MIVDCELMLKISVVWLIGKGDPYKMVNEINNKFDTKVDEVKTCCNNTISCNIIYLYFKALVVQLESLLSWDGEVMSSSPTYHDGV